MTKYQENKEKVKDEAIEWQWTFVDHNYYMSELADFSTYFTKLAKRYGLLKEFKENGII